MCDICTRAARWVPITPAIEQAEAAVVALYKANAVGGAAHIVTDDYNVDTADLQWCLDQCDEKEGRAVKDNFDWSVSESRRALNALLPMTRLQRLVAICRAHTACRAHA